MGERTVHDRRTEPGWGSPLPERARQLGGETR